MYRFYKKKSAYSFKQQTFVSGWCPAAESNYELILTMDPLYRLTSGASCLSAWIIIIKPGYLFKRNIESKDPSRNIGLANEKAALFEVLA